METKKTISEHLYCRCKRLEDENKRLKNIVKKISAIFLTNDLTRVELIEMIKGDNNEQMQKF